MSVKDKLYASFTNIRSRKGRGGVYDYISWKDVADRMNEVFGINWSSEVRSQEVVGKTVVVRVRIMVTNSETGEVQYQEGYGGAINDEAAEAGNPFKSAYSKALKDACKKWGVGLFIEEDGDVEGGMPSPPPQKMQTPPPGFSGFEAGVPPAPQAAVPVQAPVMPSSPPLQAQPVQPAVPQPAPVVSQPPQFSGGFPMPPGVQMHTPQPVPQPAAPVTPTVSVTPSAPPTTPVPPTQQFTPPPPPVPQAKPVLTPDELPMTSRTLGGGKAMISDVQRAALHSILQMQKISYEDLVREAFQVHGIVKEPIPQVDQLSYEEAVHVVKYGNDKFRKR